MWCWLKILQTHLGWWCCWVYSYFLHHLLCWCSSWILWLFSQRFAYGIQKTSSVSIKCSVPLLGPGHLLLWNDQLSVAWFWYLSTNALEGCDSQKVKYWSVFVSFLCAQLWTLLSSSICTNLWHSPKWPSCNFLK